MATHREAGFTLIELLIASTIGVIIVGVVGTAFLVGLTTASTTTDRLGESHDAQLLSSYLPSDLLSVTPATGGTDTGTATPTGCNDTAHASEQNVIRLQWSTTVDGTATSSSASYRTRHVGDEWQLVRYFCRGVTLATVTPSTVVVAHNLQAPLAAATAACPANFALAGCATVTDASTPTAGLTLTNVSGFTYTVSGSRRTPVSTTSTSSSTSTTSPPVVNPVMSSLSMADSGANGKVDRVVAVFSAALPAACNTGWSVAGGPSGATLASVAVATTTATLTLVEGSGAADTSVGSFEVTFAPAGGCTATGFAGTAPADVAPPVAMTVATTDGDGLIEPGDTMTITFSEPVTGVPATVSITETDPPSGNDTLSIPGITSGVLDMGHGAYVTENKDSLTFPGTAVAVGSRVLITVALPCAGDCASAGAGGPGSFVLDPAPTLKDAAGNVSVKRNVDPAPGSGFRVF